MRIGTVADQSGLTKKAIRYYESLGLVSSTRLANGYRDYSEQTLQTLRFIKRARDLGFAVPLCKSLVSLYLNPNRASAAVKEVARDRLTDIDEQIHRLMAMKSTLEDLINQCPGDDRPDCSIINLLAK